MRRVWYLVLLLAACSTAENEAWVVCEQFVEQRVGAEVEFDDEATIEAQGDGWYVRSRFDSGSGVTVYECVVSETGGEWTLQDLATDR